MAEYHLPIAPWDYQYLWTGEKSFLVIPDTTPPLRVGDVLVMRHPGASYPLTRWVRFLESGLGYLANYVGVEVRP